MPINKQTAKPYRDTWAAPGSALYQALADGDKKKAEQIYLECEMTRNLLENPEIANRKWVYQIDPLPRAKHYGNARVMST